MVSDESSILFSPAKAIERAPTQYRRPPAPVHGDRTVGALLDGFRGEGVVDDVASRRPVVPCTAWLTSSRAQAGMTDKHLGTSAQTGWRRARGVVALCTIWLDGERRGRALGWALLWASEGFAGDFASHSVELRGRLR